MQHQARFAVFDAFDKKCTAAGSVIITVIDHDRFGAADIQRAFGMRDIPSAALQIYKGHSARAASHPRHCRYTDGIWHARHPMCESRRDTDGIQPAHTPPKHNFPRCSYTLSHVRIQQRFYRKTSLQIPFLNV